MSQFIQQLLDDNLTVVPIPKQYQSQFENRTEVSISELSDWLSSHIYVHQVTTILTAFMAEVSDLAYDVGFKQGWEHCQHDTEVSDKLDSFLAITSYPEELENT